MNDTTRLHEQPGLLLPQALLLRAADDLAVRFAGVFGKETVERCVFDSYTALARSAKVTTHLPTLAVRFAEDRLTALAHAEGRVEKRVPEVLFVCTHNAGRSQLAMALMNHHADGAVHVRSAGTQPARHVDPTVLDVLRELGIDAAAEFPKPLTDDVVQAADVVVTTGCGDACAVYPGKRYLDWELEDPEGKSLPRVRAIRDQIDALVQDLLDELGTRPVSRQTDTKDGTS